MGKNVEIKASVKTIRDLVERISDLADSGPENIEQDDTFFKCDNGLLKLRDFSDGSGELIFYKRSKTEGPKTCFYEIIPTDAVHSLHKLLSKAYGQIGRVRKNRTLYMIGRTRVHVDQVEELGTFVELEVVLKEDESEVVGMREARELMAALGIEENALIDLTYVELLNGKGT